MIGPLCVLGALQNRPVPEDGRHRIGNQGIGYDHVRAVRVFSETEHIVAVCLLRYRLAVPDGPLRKGRLRHRFQRGVSLVVAVDGKARQRPGKGQVARLQAAAGEIRLEQRVSGKCPRCPALKAQYLAEHAVRKGFPVYPQIVAGLNAAQRQRCDGFSRQVCPAGKNPQFLVLLNGKQRDGRE